MLERLVFFAGLGQLALALGSTLIPRVLGWKRQFSALEPLLQRVFWIYAAYILATNTAFGLLSALLPGALLDGSPLAACVTAFMAIYWIARLTLQFTCLRGLGPAGRRFQVAEGLLVTAFVFFGAVYVWALWWNLSQSGLPGAVS